ncbi:thioredoxin fold domain-containing protein [Fulvimonas sp. R45]|uniref:disulfide isomerase DsbC N-terminal domain-containing protein n=1 Tax=Fulvimonas sp. R45 TaxID=3045937 RepID=UPI00265E4D8D|nr:disulfide isomerase DsbC N-terminal domain-containing protein [Fulvimonas sp. R45]MDO1528185.1 thioredoxin fold domain-containing protein [Fulvimonas sp. R45]
MLRKWLLAACIGGFALGACAAGDPGAAANVPDVVRQALQKFAPGLKIDVVEPAPLPGFYQVIAAGQLVYVSDDGKYMLHGDLVDLASRKSLGDAAWAKFRKAELAKVPAAQRIVFAPPDPKYTVTVFTDVNCGFCRALHEHVAAFNKEGIAVDYLAWPREGVTTTSGRPTPTYTEMVSVWCAADRKAVFTEAKEGHAPKPASCTNPVKSQFDLGVKLGVSGTPTIIAEDGTVIGGYLTPEQMLDAVRKHSAG